jgi:hypothetical protein
VSVLVLSVWSVASCVVVKFGSVALVQSAHWQLLQAPCPSMLCSEGLDTPPVSFFESNSRNVGDDT